MITADHGNDPTFRGTDHTRECVPILAHAPGAGRAGRSGAPGARFADVGATLARHLGLQPTASGAPWPYDRRRAGVPRAAEAARSPAGRRFRRHLSRAP